MPSTPLQLAPFSGTTALRVVLWTFPDGDSYFDRGHIPKELPYTDPSFLNSTPSRTSRQFTSASSFNSQRNLLFQIAVTEVLLHDAYMPRPLKNYAAVSK